MDLLDTNVVSELRRSRPHGAVVFWITPIPGEHLFLSAVTVGELQLGIEKTRIQDIPRALALESWLESIVATYRVLPMRDLEFRLWLN